MNNEIDYYFIKSGSRSAQIVLQTRWENTSLGDVTTWPTPLKTILSLIFHSTQPMIVWWGDDAIQFCNDAALNSFFDATNLDSAIGCNILSIENSSQLPLDMITSVMKSGISHFQQNINIANKKTESSQWSANFSAIHNTDAEICGVLAIFQQAISNEKASIELHKSRQEFDFAIEAAELGTFDLDPATGKFSSNQRLKGWFGIAPDDEIPLNLALDVIADYDRERVSLAIADAMDFKKASKYEIEYTIINPKTKQERIVFAKGCAEFDNQNQAVHFSGTVQDITSYRKANDEIIKSRAITDLAIKNMGIGVFTVDFNTESLEYSHEFAHIISGNSATKLGFNDTVNYIHPEDLELRAAAFELARKTGTLNYSPRVIWHDGSIHRIAVSAVQIKDTRGNSNAYSGMVEDITQKEINRIALEEANMRLEQTKRETYAMFENVTNSSPTGLWLSDHTGKLTYLNKTLVDWTGLEYNQLLQHGWASAIIEEDIALTFEQFQDCIIHRKHYDVLFRIRKSTGEIIWVRSAGDPFYNESGEFLGFAGFCMDMDEIITGRRALADSEERFSLMIEQSPLAICLFSGMDMKIEIVNNVMLKYWNRDRSVIGLDLHDAMPELKEQPFLQLLQNVYTTGENYTATESPAYIMVDGELKKFYFDYTYKPIRDSKGVVYGIMNVANNVTERVLSNQKLNEAQSALSGAIELVGLATWKIDIDAEEISFSDRFTTWLGLSNSQVAKDDFYDLILESHRYKVRQAVDHAIATKDNGFVDLEFPIKNQTSSQVRIIHTSAQIIYDSDGIKKFLSGTAQDVTKERKLQEELKFKVKESTAELRKVNSELEINNQELQQFAYIASHDLQEPVRKITVFMQMVESYLESDPEKAKSYINKIKSSTKRMTDLIKDVLGFSELAKTSRVYEKTDLNQMVRHVLNDFDLIMEQRGATVVYNDLPTVEAIPLQMSQLFGNLISNALKYSKADVPPKVEIFGGSLSDSEKSQFDVDQNVDYYKVDVIDNGIGFKQKYADQIFNIFQRLHGKEEFAGTGIGLAMCRKIMQNHHGDIVAKSQEGIGTTFTIIVPKIYEKR